MELIAYWNVIRRRLWLIALLVCVCCTGAAFYSLRKEPEYDATTTLFLNPAAAESVLQDWSTVESLANTYSEFMRTSSFAAHVIKELGLPLSENQIFNVLSTHYVPGTQFFRITATSPDAHLAQALANTSAQVLIAENTVRQQAQQQQIEAQRSRSQEPQRLQELQQALEEELKSYNEQIVALQSEIDRLQNNSAAEDASARIQILRQQLLPLQTARVDILNSLVRTQSDLASNNQNTHPNIDTAVVVDPAPLPVSPASRGTLRNVVLAFAVALVTGLGLTFLLEYLNNTIRTADALGNLYGLAAGGIIGSSRRRWRRANAPPELITITDAYSQLAEAFRSLRIGVDIAGVDAPIRSLLITSAVAREGKTFVAANLAVSLAQNDSRVILVDTDLRQPTLHQVFSLPREPGFTNLLSERQAELADFLQPTGIDNLWVLTSGTIPARPTELLGSQRSAKMMERLKDHADIVIYDTPPAVALTDAIVLASRVDAVMQVVGANRTRVDLVLQCKAALERVGANLLGPVLNGVSIHDFRPYTSYYYHSPDGLSSASRGKLFHVWAHRLHHAHPSEQSLAIPSATVEEAEAVEEAGVILDLASSERFPVDKQ